MMSSTQKSNGNRDDSFLGNNARKQREEYSENTRALKTTSSSSEFYRVSKGKSIMKEDQSLKQRSNVISLPLSKIMSSTQKSSNVRNIVKHEEHSESTRALKATRSSSESCRVSQGKSIIEEGRSLKQRSNTISLSLSKITSSTQKSNNVRKRRKHEDHSESTRTLKTTRSSSESCRVSQGKSVNQEDRRLKQRSNVNSHSLSKIMSSTQISNNVRKRVKHEDHSESTRALKATRSSSESCRISQGKSILEEWSLKQGSTPGTSRTARDQKKPFCGICMENQPLSNIIFIKGCSHSYCSRCVGGYVSAKVEENVAVIACPYPGCKYGTLKPELCKPMLARKVFDRWCYALCVSAIKNKFYCPFKDCSALLADESRGEVIRKAECPHCHRLFCAQCKVSWHSKITCKIFQKLPKKEREREDLMLMNLAKKKGWNRCPMCRFFVEKLSGCLSIKCRCGHIFCYNCGTTMTTAHYCAACKH